MRDDDGLILAELIAARLCHDLAGPLGAVATGAELLQDEGGQGAMAAEALALLSGSAAAAAGRLRFYRLAFGAGSSAQAGGDLKALVEGFLGPSGGGPDIRLDWRDGRAELWPWPHAKILLNLVLATRDCLPRGGTILVSLSDGKDLARLEALGQDAAPGEAARALMGQDNGADLNNLGHRGVQGYYLRRLAEQAGIALSVSVAAGRVLLVATQY